MGDQLFNQYDYTSLDTQDPSLAEGHRVLYDRQVPFNIKYEDKSLQTQEIPNQEKLRVRLLVLGDELEPSQLRIELSTDKDLFFHFTHSCNLQGFQVIKQYQKLSLEYKDYSSLIIKSFNKCIEDQSYSSILFVNEGEARVEIHQSTEYKNIEIIKFEFFSTQDDLIRKIITYRYNQEKSKLEIQQGRLQDIIQIIQIKNPSLYMQIQATAQKNSQKQKPKKVVK